MVEEVLATVPLTVAAIERKVVPAVAHSFTFHHGACLPLREDAPKGCMDPIEILFHIAYARTW
jgi:hypothetical protein